MRVSKNPKIKEPICKTEWNQCKKRHAEKFRREVSRRLDRLDDMWLTLADAARYLGYEISYMYKITHYKLIPFYKPTPKKIFFLKSDLDNWIMSNKIRSKGEIKEISDSYLCNKISEKVRYRDKSSKKLDAE